MVPLLPKRPSYVILFTAMETKKGRPASAECPSCGRFVGPYATCPYCGADVGQRMALRAFKIGSLVLAIAGVAVLLLVASRIQPPAVQAGSLGGTMNWAYVRLGGVVSSQPTLDGETGALRFWLEDGTGEIMVMAYRPEAEALLAAGQLPVMGDPVSLDGTLHVKDDFRYLVINVPQQVQIQAAEPLKVSIAAVDGDRQYERVIVEGVIRDERAPYEGLRVLTLRDTTGEIDVALAEEAAAFGGPLPELVPGQALRVAGAVDLYRGQPQISVGRCDDLTLLDGSLPIAKQQSIGELSSANPGDMATIQGTVTCVDAFSQGVKLALDDGTGTVTLLLWQNLYEALPESGALAEGTTLRALGRVEAYRGELELVPELPIDVEILATAQPAAVQPTVSGRASGRRRGASGTGRGPHRRRPALFRGRQVHAGRRHGQAHPATVAGDVRPGAGGGLASAGSASRGAGQSG